MSALLAQRCVRTSNRNHFVVRRLAAAVLGAALPAIVSAATLTGVTVTYSSATNKYSETFAFSDGSTTTTTGSGQVVDVTPVINANVPMVLNNVNALVVLAVSSTEYDSVISGTGTLEVSQNLNPTAAIGTGATVTTQTSDGSANPIVNGATLTLTGLSTLTLPPVAATESIVNSTVLNPNPPVMTIDPGVTLVFAGNGSTQANLLAADSSGQINFDNILNNGTLFYTNTPGALIGLVSGAGGVSAASSFIHGSSTTSGVLEIGIGTAFGVPHVGPTSLPNASAVINEGSLVVSSPAGSPTIISQNIYESHFGSDINTGSGVNIFGGVYSNSNNTSRQRPNLVNPGLVDCTKTTPFTGTIGVTGNPADFNTMVVGYSGSNFTALTHTDTNACQDSALDDGSSASFRGINIEGGYTQWGDGTTNVFFLPATPDNSYINLHSNATLAIDYSGSTGPVVLNVPIGGGAINNSLTTPGVGTVHILNPTGGRANVIFSQPMFYNGPTIIDAGATLQLGAGKQTVTYKQNINLAVNTLSYTPPTVFSTYSGDSLLLISQIAPGNVNDSIVDEGTLLVNNTENPITLSNITGSGQVIQSSQANAAALSGIPDTAASGQATLLGFLPGSVAPAVPTLTLTGNNSYTGGTTVTANSVLIVDGSSALGGSGSGLAVQGILKATDATGTINVPGNYSQAPAKPAPTSVKANVFKQVKASL